MRKILVDVDFPCCDRKIRIKVPKGKRRVNIICYECWKVHGGHIEANIYENKPYDWVQDERSKPADWIQVKSPYIGKGSKRR